MSVLSPAQLKRAQALWPSPFDRKLYAAALIDKVHQACMETLTSPTWTHEGVEYLFLPGALAGAARADRIRLPCLSFNEQVGLTPL